MRSVGRNNVPCWAAEDPSLIEPGPNPPDVNLRVHAIFPDFVLLGLWVSRTPVTGCGYIAVVGSCRDVQCVETQCWLCQMLGEPLPRSLTVHMVIIFHSILRFKWSACNQELWRRKPLLPLLQIPPTLPCLLPCWAGCGANP